jgi:glycosyltransferase involved in cell wall biosynthesis
MTKRETPLITVIIPTRNRCETLRATLKTCVEQDADKLRVIVSDNCSDDETREVVRSFSDTRIRYINTGTRLSMTGNFEFSLRHAESGYVTFLGDDDGLMPGAARRVAELVADTGSDAITSTSVYYSWPNFPFKHWRNMALVRDLGNAIEWKNAKREVARLISYRGLERNYIWGLPSVYRGFISSDIIKRATRNGRYFHSVTPDAYSAFVNSFFIDSYVYLHAPLTIEGVSGKSNGASQIFGKDQREETQYLSENDIEFNPELVYAPNPPIILAEAYLQARAQFPQHCVDHDFSIARVCKAALRDIYSGPNRGRVEIAVAKIRSMHGLSAFSTEPFRFSRVLDNVALLRKCLHEMEIQCDCFDAFDVYQASLVVSHLLSQRSRGGTWRGLRLAIRKVVSRIFRDNDRETNE